MFDLLHQRDIIYTEHTYTITFHKKDFMYVVGEIVGPVSVTSSPSRQAFSMLALAGCYLDRGGQVARGRHRRLHACPAQAQRPEGGLHTDATLLNQPLAPVPTLQRDIFPSLAVVRIQRRPLAVHLGHGTRTGAGSLASQPRQSFDHLDTEETR